MIISFFGAYFSEGFVHAFLACFLEYLLFCALSGALLARNTQALKTLS